MCKSIQFGHVIAVNNLSVSIIACITHFTRIVVTESNVSKHLARTAHTHTYKLH